MSMNRDNFRSNQPPSKVLHVRNLPPDAVENDVAELCRPFGRIVRIRMAGAGKCQAFVEFDSVTAALQMISFFVGNADGPKVLNKSVYLTFSTRQEIGTMGSFGGGASGGATGAADGTGCVLLVIMDNIQVAQGPTLDTINMVFSAFGPVAKIAVFEKASGLQALVQFKESKFAREAKAALDGRTIPAYLVPDHPGEVKMKVSYSAHSDLTVRYQGERSRDYTNPSLPTAPTDGSGQAAQFAVHVPGMPDPTEGNVLLVMVDDVQYPVTADALRTIFSTYGFVQKLTIFEKSGNWQALVQYDSNASAASAKQSLEGYSMYEGGANKLKMTYSLHRELNVRTNDERNYDYSMAARAAAAAPGAAAAAADAAAGSGANGSNGHAAAGQGIGPASAAEAAVSDEEEEEEVDVGPEEEGLLLKGADFEHAHEEVAHRAIAELNGGNAPGPSPHGHGAYHPAPYGGYGPPGYGAPGYGPPGYGAPGYGPPAYGAPGYGAPGYGPPGYGAPGYGAPGYGAPGYGAPGYGYGPPAAYGAGGYGAPPPYGAYGGGYG